MKGGLAILILVLSLLGCENSTIAQSKVDGEENLDTAQFNLNKWQNERYSRAMDYADSLQAELNIAKALQDTDWTDTGVEERWARDSIARLSKASSSSSKTLYGRYEENVLYTAVSNYFMLNNKLTLKSVNCPMGEKNIDNCIIGSWLIFDQDNIEGNTLKGYTMILLSIAGDTIVHIHQNPYKNLL